MEKESKELAITNQGLGEAVEKTNLQVEKARIIMDIFSPFVEECMKWGDRVKGIKITHAEQKREMKVAREGRLVMRTLRLAVEAKRKELKEDALREGQAIDAAARYIKSYVEPLEKHLHEQEQFVEIQRQKQEEEARLLRELEEKKRLAREEEERREAVERSRIKMLQEKLRLEEEVRKSRDEKDRLVQEQIKERKAMEAERASLEQERLRLLGELSQAKIYTKEEADAVFNRGEKEQEAEIPNSRKIEIETGAAERPEHYYDVTCPRCEHAFIFIPWED